MEMTQFAGSHYVKLDDVRTKPPPVRTIIGVEMGNYDRPQLRFEDGSLLSLNKTNTRALIKAFGDDSDAWIGHEVELRAGITQYQGQTTETILLRPVTPRKIAVKPALVPASDSLEEDIPF
jgi:hypothetical protein